MKFNEDSCVKIIIFRLIVLGYQYLPLKGQSQNLCSNMFGEIFNKAILKMNLGIGFYNVKRPLEGY